MCVESNHFPAVGCLFHLMIKTDWSMQRVSVLSVLVSVNNENSSAGLKAINSFFCLTFAVKDDLVKCSLTLS